MGITNFPNGVSSFGAPILAGGDDFTTGNIFFVSSTATAAADSTDHGTSTTQPFATIDFAIGRCTANNGDIIYVMPGHAEATVTAAITMDVAGVWVRGLGWGANRPTLTFTGTAGTILMSADSCRLSGIRLVPGIADVVAAITMTADDLIVENCETLSAAVFEFTTLLDVGITTAGSNRSIIRNNLLKCLQSGASSTSGILLSGSNDVQILGNVIMGFFSEHCIDNTSGTTPDECLAGLFTDNYIQNAGTGTDLCVDMDAAATGFLVNNQCSGTGTLDANWVSGNMRNSGNLLSDLDDVHAVGIPATAAA